MRREGERGYERRGKGVGRIKGREKGYSKEHRMRHGHFYCSMYKQVLFKMFFNRLLFRRNNSKLENLK